MIQDHERRLKALEEKKTASFIKPTIQDIKEYVLSLGLTTFDVDSFYFFYESKGWMVGKNKMKSWRAAVGTWQRRNAPEVAAKVRLYPIAGRVCGKCGMPAVYKSAGDFDHFYCSEHMPEKIKQKYTG